MAMQWNEKLAVGVDVIDNQHKGIISRINNLLKKEFETGSVTTTLVLQTQRVLCDWLTNHITNKDKQIGVFIKKCA